MLSFFKKSLLLSILTLLFTSCAAKTDGKYHTKYSYYSLYATKMSNNSSKKTKVKAKVKKSQLKPKLSSSSKSRFPTNN